MTILTPVTLWKDFDDTLPFDEEILFTEDCGEYRHQGLTFLGREVAGERVKLFAHFFTPNTATYPVVLVLFEAGLPCDVTLVEQLLKEGYGVFALDYCGEDGTDTFTVYPKAIDYANFARAGRTYTHADTSAKETCWYEWAGATRYAVKYLRSKSEVTKVGALGLRTGGEVLWKVAPFAQLDCIIPVCAAGWLAYAGRSKFGKGGKEEVFDEERHRFIAGIESQSYAPYCKCPVLLLGAINDKKYNCDRVYDTFRAINPEVEKAVLFSARGSGLLGTHTFVDVKLFLDKYLKERSVFVSKPVEVFVEEDEEGNLIARGSFDEDGEIEESGIFYTEADDDYRTCEWVRVLWNEEEEKHEYPLEVYEKSRRILIYAFVRYSNGFSVTSKILEFPLEKRYPNACGKSRVIYDSAEGVNGFSAYRLRLKAIADCFVIEEGAMVKRALGYGGIEGISCDLGLITHRIGQARYRAPEGVSLKLDAWSEADTTIKAIVIQAEEEGQVVYTATEWIEGGGKWKSLVFDPTDFKSDTGSCLEDFTGGIALVLLGEKTVFNNVLWL